MHRTLILGLLLLAPICLSAQTLDTYGGDSSHPCVGIYGPNSAGHTVGSAIPGATGYFYLYKDTSLHRWMFCDPLGNRFFEQAIELMNFNITPFTGGSKYGSSPNSNQDIYNIQITRMKALGFNAHGDGADVYALPIASNGGTIQPLANKVPFNFQIRPSLSANYPVAYVKNIWSFLPPAYTSWRGSTAFFADIWDAAFATHVTDNLDGPGAPWNGSLSTIASSPWFIGTAIDESDQTWCIQGFQNIGFSCGWLAGVTAPYEAIGLYQGTTNSVLTKTTGFRNYICGGSGVYTNVTALNAAWGSSYTTCDSTATTVTSETIGTGTGSQTSFSHTFAHGTVDPASIGISVGGALQGYDCPWFATGVTGCSGSSGTGLVKTLTGNINGGTVTYASGGAACGGQSAPCITVTFSSAPGNGVAITATYQYGGWPKATAGGTGLMDEDGSSSWWPACCGAWTATGPSAGIQTNLDNFDIAFMTQYLSTIVTAVKAKLPNTLIFSVDGLNFPNRPGILTTYGKYVDAPIIFGGNEPSGSMNGSTMLYGVTYPNNTALSIAAYNEMGIPCLMGLFGLPANEESSFYNINDPFGHCGNFDCQHTQQARGQAYQNYMLAWQSTFVGADGYGFVPGIRWWDWWDHSPEQQNFGLISLKDNIYDGRQTTNTSLPDSLMDGTSPFTIPEVGITAFTGTQSASDNFTRANVNPLAGNWTTQSGMGALQIVSNAAQATGTTADDGAYYNAITWPNDQYSQITIGTMANALDFPYAMVRMQGGAASGYICFAGGPTGGTAQIFLDIITAGTQTILQSKTVTINSTDRVAAFAVGTSIGCTVNGITVVNATDSTYASGNAGLGINTDALANTTITGWSGGSAAASPSGITFGDAASAIRWSNKIWLGTQTTRRVNSTARENGITR